jgi:YkoP-like protein
MNVLRRCSQAVLGVVDAWYYRRYRLRTLGPVLFLGHARYRGPELRFEDGTLLRDNDPIGRLHFNNASIAALGEGSLHRVGFRFAKLMRESLRALAEVAQTPACGSLPSADERIRAGRAHSRA